MNKKLIIYYLIICAVVLGKTAATVFARSQAVNHGFTIAAVRGEQRKLLAEKRALTSQLAEKRSLTTVAQAPELSTYSRITNPVVLSVPTQTTLASVALAE